MRVDASRAAYAARTRQKAGKKSSSAGTGYKATPATSWVMPGAQKKGGAWGTTAKPAAAKKKKPAGGSVFAAMMMDDSDSD